MVNVCEKVLIICIFGAVLQNCAQATPIISDVSSFKRMQAPFSYFWNCCSKFRWNFINFCFTKYSAPPREIRGDIIGFVKYQCALACQDPASNQVSIRLSNLFKWPALTETPFLWRQYCKISSPNLVMMMQLVF